MILKPTPETPEQAQ